MFAPLDAVSDAMHARWYHHPLALVCLLLMVIAVVNDNCALLISHVVVVAFKLFYVCTLY